MSTQKTLSDLLTKFFIDAAERGFAPDFVIRAGIRNLCSDRIDELYQGNLDQRAARFEDHVAKLRASPIAVETQAANHQHYEVPPEFFTLALGPNLKYSSCYYPTESSSLEEAERESLDQTMKRAEISDGHSILELGCGWGSLTLAMAARFPKSQITAISNSAPQRLFIEAQAAQRGLKNITVKTANLAFANDLELPRFDRIVSVEMMEHVRNYDAFFRNIARWLTDDGKMFVHIFTHHQYAYVFETDGEDNWMGRHFFTGGQMPSHDLFWRFQHDLQIERTWAWSGTHYSKTSEHWLENLDRNRDRVLAIFEKEMPRSEARIMFQRWRMFFMACAELFGFNQGTQWGVSHYLFKKRN